MKIRNNNGRCMIRFKCPLNNRVVSHTAGNFYDKQDRHDMDGLIIKLTTAIREREWNGDITSYLPEDQKVKVTSLKEALRIKAQGDDKSIYATVRRLLPKTKELCTPSEVSKWLDKLKVAPASYNRYRTVIGGVRPDLIEGIKPKHVPKVEPEPFTLEEQARLLDSFIDTDSEHLVTFWLKCGFRNGELAALTYDDFKKKGDSCWIEINKSFSKGVLKLIPKNKKARKVHLTYSDWMRYRARYKLEHNLYRNMDWNNWIRGTWKPLLVRANIPYAKPYTLRKTAISNYLHAGNTAMEAAKVFGTSIAMIDGHYAGLVTSAPVV